MARLAIDIGNSNIVFGLHAEGRWQNQWRIMTHRQSTEDEYAARIGLILSSAGVSLKDCKQRVLSSVVPSLTPLFTSLLDRNQTTPTVVVNRDLDLPIRIRPKIVGSDWIANAIAAYQRFQKACLIVDFGTATSFVALDAEGTLLGGAIAAGLNTSASALVDGASQLSQITLAAPEKAIGHDTQTAMQSGLVLGHIGMVDNLIKHMLNELGQTTDVEVIATGGHATLLAPLSHTIQSTDPWLTLEGLRLISESVEKTAAV